MVTTKKCPFCNKREGALWSNPQGCFVFACRKCYWRRGLIRARPAGGSIAPWDESPERFNVVRRAPQPVSEAATKPNDAPFVVAPGDTIEVKEPDASGKQLLADFYREIHDSIVDECLRVYAKAGIRPNGRSKGGGS